MMMDAQCIAPVLSVTGLAKSFSGKTVVRDVTFELRPGQVLALVGENGAGKSTTKNMLCGLVEPSAGTITLPQGSAGIAAVHQELSLFASLTVAENMCVADMPGSPARMDLAEAAAQARAELAELGIDIDVNSPVERLGAGRRQVVEICKALRARSDVLILDEPTTSLTSVEREALFRIIADLSARGLAIIFISHFMEEIYRVCDSYLVLRDGQQVASGRLADMPQRALEEAMVGRTLADARVDLAPAGQEVALRVNGLKSPDFTDISFDLRRGEILGLSGLMGAGRTEIAEAIFGLRPSSGMVEVNGTPVDRTVPAMKAAGVCYVPEDRRAHGMFLNRPLKENLSAAALLAFVRRRVPGIGFSGEKRAAEDVVHGMDIAAPSVANASEDLSGGNQQKALIGRWLAAEPHVLILDEPTKGVDIGAKHDIHQRIAELAAQGRSILLISSDLPELLNLSHRVLVMRKGRLVGALDRSEFDPVRIISLAASEAGT